MHPCPFLSEVSKRASENRPFCPLKYNDFCVGKSPKGSRHPNMKELRFDAADGVWRVAFAFDPERKAILLAAGDKTGGSDARFYRRLIAKADERFADHLTQQKG